MFSRTELKEIALKKLIFPDFSNTMTKYVVGLGATIVLTPAPLKQLFYNWLVDTFNLNSGQHFSFADIQSNSADYWLGFSLIFIALIHNIAYRVFIYKSEKLERDEKDKLIQVDKELYQSFIELLPSDGATIQLLEEHDFGASYHKNSTKDLDTFIYTWNNAQKEFLDEELESKRSDFLKKILEFSNTLALRSYNIGGSTYSCIPDAYRGAWEWPKHVDEQINLLNSLASECFEKHKELILLARRKLKC
ncbi:hypothetical protein [Pseudoalteromonas sp. NZS100]|uniref:hypothetical protein n=1 Tax=Pseudoalteromonas sp. NZS100 TaxID=2792046 RepID=UPI0018CD80AB|nr:hypothetical protein [Pseudoalteromonas sp. NZS100]